MGRALAKQLELPFTDLDAFIESEVGESVPNIFKGKGELFFRKKEHELMLHLLESGQDLVLSLGGGTPAYAGNMERIVQATANSFYLQHSIPSLVERLAAEKAQRPLIAHLGDEDLPEFIGKHLFDRGPYYLQAAHTIACGEKSAEALVKEISEMLV